MVFELTAGMVIHDSKIECNYAMRAADDGEHVTREILTIKRCPLQHNCTKKDGSNPSWQRMLPWTVLDGKTEQVAKLELLGNLKYHLKWSGHHKMSEEDCEELLRRAFPQLEFHQYTDTYAMRDAYRKQLEGIEAKAKHTAEPHAKKRKGNGKQSMHDHEQASSSNRDETAAPSVSDLVTALAPAIQQSLAQYMDRDRPFDMTAGDSINLQVFNAPQAPAGTPSGSITIDVQRLVQAREYVRRAEEAAQSSLCTMVEAAKRMRSECMVLASAREGLDQLLREHRC